MALRQKKNNNFFFQDKAIKTAYQKKYSQNETITEVDDLCKLIDSKLILLAKSMDFSDKDIRLAAEKRKTLGLSNFINIEELIEALISSQPSPSLAASSSQKSPVQEESNKNCVICWETDYDTLLKPCNHLVCCDKCARRQKECPCCRAIITEYVKVFTP